MNRLLPRGLMAPAVIALLLWMLVPLLMTVWFSLVNYNLMQPGQHGFAGLANYEYFITDPDFWPAVANTLLLIGSVIGITVVLGVLLALLVNDPFPGRGIVRVLLISPFFVMPAVNALLWKHMMMNPIYGVLANVWKFFGLAPVDWLTDVPLFSVIVMVAWQWLPFACLIFITSLQSLDREQMEAARMDGASAVQRFWYLTLPHLARPMAVVIMIEMIFLLSVFAEIAITTAGGPGNESTNLTYLIFKQSLMNFDVGVASAGALFAVVLANVVAVFLIRIIGKNLD
ncbi:MAG: ABC transporter permease subunit [Hydrogenophaga sp.]|uniref:carbohydrate ABC transporter permease n=1 Tax=Hydrogenophaga sp. TaxID=1904254 RepID=UPI00169A2BB5|nr:sugar ABC transporter permease [Hydrogenophaga sp.]NIM43871.1 ABC transporter permease subunit [Hydrogenophaga sp.]NIN28937.1 ABC transporter permease subunit [Hydrogenophaga sp.]NIN33396.1 ABC transporter permease subunit [Hydrogenophaga sp.]NIN58071.1 ABC transporter permease subunit [Hydrogenophaga sp.]NIO54369.1 ABC transporter permease subunit [Hydrogenophaga sp.]